MRQRDEAKGRIKIAVIPAPDRIPGKTPHRCFWHDDQHPSAVTFFHADGRCMTFCSAENRKSWGEYEIVGGSAYIYAPSHRARPSVLQTTRVVEETKGDAYGIFVRFCFSVYRKEKPRPLSSLRENDFWYTFLLSKRVNVLRAARVENPPLVISVGILFPTHIYRQASLIPHSGQLRTVGIKSLSLWKTGEGDHYYIPAPSKIGARSVLVVESPFVALRLSYLGIPAIATLGKVEKYEDIASMLSPSLPIFVWDEPGWGHAAQDFDMLSDSEIVKRLRRMLCQEC